MGPIPTSRSRLDADQVSRYRDEGYLVVPEPIFAEDRFRALKACFERLLSDVPSGTRPEGMDEPHFIYPELFSWLFDDAMLDLVEPLLGPDIALFASHFICKPAGDGQRVPWHEDSAYWHGLLSPMDVVTVWLAIDDSDAGNGGVRVIPGSHGHGLSEYEPVADRAENLFHREMRKDQFDATRAVTIELAANHAHLQDAKLMHGSDRNRSQRRRCGYSVRYISARTRLHESCSTWHQLYLARGRGHDLNTYADPAQRYFDKMQARGGYLRKGH
jgi:hypothetical protein